MLHETNPVGKRLVVEATPGSPETYFEIIGMARDAKFEDLREEDLPVVYLVSTQDHFPFHRSTISNSLKSSASGNHRCCQSQSDGIQSRTRCEFPGVQNDGPGVTSPRATDGNALRILWRAGVVVGEHRTLRTSCLTA